MGLLFRLYPQTLRCRAYVYLARLAKWIPAAGELEQTKDSGSRQTILTFEPAEAADADPRGRPILRKRMYPIVTHAFNFVGRGALGLFQASTGGPAVEGGHRRSSTVGRADKPCGPAARCERLAQGTRSNLPAAPRLARRVLERGRGHVLWQDVDPVGDRIAPVVVRPVPLEDLPRSGGPGHRGLALGVIVIAGLAGGWLAAPVAGVAGERTEPVLT